MVVAGIDTNIALFQELLVQPDIIDGNYNIHWAGKLDEGPGGERLIALAAHPR